MTNSSVKSNSEPKERKKKVIKNIKENYEQLEKMIVEELNLSANLQPDLSYFQLVVCKT